MKDDPSLWFVWNCFPLLLGFPIGLDYCDSLVAPHWWFGLGLGHLAFWKYKSSFSKRLPKSNEINYKLVKKYRLSDWRFCVAKEMQCFFNLLQYKSQNLNWIITHEGAFLFGDRKANQTNYIHCYRKNLASPKRDINRSVFLISVSATQKKCSSHLFEMMHFKEMFLICLPQKGKISKRCE